MMKNNFDYVEIEKKLWELLQTKLPIEDYERIVDFIVENCVPMEDWKKGARIETIIEQERQINELKLQIQKLEDKIELKDIAFHMVSEGSQQMIDALIKQLKTL